MEIDDSFGKILVFVLLGLSIYLRFIKSRVDTFFVMNDGQCKCNPNNLRKTCSSEYCHNKLKLKIGEKIDSAREEILIAMYNFSNHSLVNWILDARERGVSVRIIVDKSESEKETNPKHDHIKTMIDKGVKVRKSGDEKYKMHNKFCVIDPESAFGIVVSGSLNWSYAAFNHCENVTFISNMGNQKQYKKAFENMWKHCDCEPSLWHRILGY